MTTICSWDVGIKNLAYCIMSKKGDETNIIRWDIINLVKDDDKRCMVLKKNKKVCGNKAGYVGMVAKNPVYYCGSHKHNHKPYKFGWENNIMIPVKEKNKNIKCTYILPKKKQPCGKIAHYIDNSPKNEYCCNVHRKLVIKHLKKEAALKKIKRKKCTAKDHQILAETLTKELDKIPELDTVDIVLIENQPSLRNPSMKTIGAFLFQCLVIRGLDKGLKRKVMWMCPSNKLKVNEDKSIEIVKNAKNSTEKYKLTKALAVKYTRKLIQNDKKWLDHFESFKKKDDVSDAFLFCKYYIHRNLSS